MTFQLKILGSNSATPAYGRHHTAQVLNVQQHHFLIDCGEGTQSRLLQYKCKLQRINHIFISHLHGDHFLGLMGLIFTMQLLKRRNTLYIYSQKGLQEIITTQLKYSSTALDYAIIFKPLNTEGAEVIYKDEVVEVKSFPLNHRIPCCGFTFREKPKPLRINKEKLPNNILLQHIIQLKRGEDVYKQDGSILYHHKDLTLPPRKSRSYAYCSDTKYEESIIPHIKNVDLLYHEATFLAERSAWAEQTYHTTTLQAAEMAKKVSAGTLIIGHFSSRYKDLSPFLIESKSIFENTQLAIEGETIAIQD